MKTQQLQIRVTPEEKKAIKREADKARRDVSSWVLEKCLKRRGEDFLELTRRLGSASDPSYVLAEINDFLTKLPQYALHDAVSDPPPGNMALELRNRVAAMVEYAAAKNNLEAPEWTRDIPPLQAPSFDSALISLRLHLLINSPPPFKRRNIFLDASIGARV